MVETLRETRSRHFWPYLKKTFSKNIFWKINLRRTVWSLNRSYSKSHNNFAVIGFLFIVEGIQLGFFVLVLERGRLVEQGSHNLDEQWANTVSFGFLLWRLLKQIQWGLNSSNQSWILDLTSLGMWSMDKMLFLWTPFNQSSVHFLDHLSNYYILITFFLVIFRKANHLFISLPNWIP